MIPIASRKKILADTHHCMLHPFVSHVSTPRWIDPAEAIGGSPPSFELASSSDPKRRVLRGDDRRMRDSGEGGAGVQFPRRRARARFARSEAKMRRRDTRNVAWDEVRATRVAIVSPASAARAARPPPGRPSRSGRSTTGGGRPAGGPRVRARARARDPSERPRPPLTRPPPPRPLAHPPRRRTTRTTVAVTTPTRAAPARASPGARPTAHPRAATTRTSARSATTPP